MSSITNIEVPIGVFAVPLEIEGVGADGVLPPAASTDGARLLIPMWTAPSIEDGKSDLLEIWVREPGATTDTRFYSNFFPVPVTIPPFFLLPAHFLQRNGDIDLHYRVTIGDNGNEDTSSPQTFIVRRPIPINLEEPTFPHATWWGYLNCISTPKLWEEVWVEVKAQPGRFEAGDECVLDWEGFNSLNGSKPIPGTKLQIKKILTKTDADIGPLFILGSDKYEQYIKPMEADASALAYYTLFRNNIALGRSPPGLVKIDRRVSGSSPCGPALTEGLSATAVGTEVINDAQSSNTLVPGTCSLPSHDSSFGNNADSSNTHSLMESTNMNMPVDPSVKDSQVTSGVGVLAEPPQIVDQLPDGRLTYKQLKEDGTIKVRLTNIEDAGGDGGATVELHIVPPGTLPVDHDPATLAGTKSKPAAGWAFPIEFDVETTNLLDRFNAAGDYAQYDFVFLIYDLFDNPDTSSPLEVLVDLTAPYQLQPGRGNGTGTRPTLLTLGGTVPAEVNDAWLNDPANAGGLNLTIPTAYTKFEAGSDIVNFYISLQTTFALMQGETAAFSGPLVAGGIINIPLDFLRALPEGTYYYSYNLTDLPGNISNNAAITNLFRRVVAPAPALAPPQIPVTGVDGGTPITFTTVAPAPSKTIMEISYTATSNWLPGDRIIPFINSDTSGGPIMLPEQVVPAPGTAGKLEFLVDYDTWASVFGNANSAGEVEFEYWYELARTTITPNPTSPSTFGVLDLSYAGPEQPNLPELENPNITPVVVQGAGTPAPAPNTLTPAQAGFDATMIWSLWTDLARPITGREVVTFYYQGKQVGAPIPVRSGDTQVSTPLPWETIMAEGNGTGANARKAYITISYPGSPNVMSQVPPTDVQVTAIVINLPMPQLVISGYKTPTGSTIAERIATSINCPSLNHPVVPNGPMPPYQTRRLRIRIRPDSNIPAGATVNLVFEGRTTNAVDAPVIPGTLITRSGPMPASGNLEFFLTEYDTIKIIQLPPVGTSRPATRYARIAYTVNGATAVTTVPVALLNSSLVYCEEERPEVP